MVDGKTTIYLDFREFLCVPSGAPGSLPGQELRFCFILIRMKRKKEAPKMNHKELKTACQKASARGRATNKAIITAKKQKEKAVAKKRVKEEEARLAKSKKKLTGNTAAQKQRKRREAEAKRKLLARARKILAQLPAAMERIAAQGGNEVVAYKFKHPDKRQYAIEENLTVVADSLRRAQHHPRPTGLAAIFSADNLRGLAKIVYDFLVEAGLSPELGFVGYSKTVPPHDEIEIRVRVIRPRSRR